MELDIDHVAHLARLALTEEEKARLEPQLEEILTYVGRLRELDTEGIEATFHVSGRERVNVLRDDAEDLCLDPEAALRNAPAREGPYFRIPRILEE